MIEDADRNALAYVEAGAGSVTFHVEAARAPVRLAREIRAAGARASMALKPATPIEPYEDLLPELDMLLIMTVEPGFGGQKFLDLCLPEDPARPGAARQARHRDLAPGRRRRLAGDDRAVRRGRRRRVRRRARPSTPPTTPTGWSPTCGPAPRPPRGEPAAAVGVRRPRLPAPAAPAPARGARRAGRGAGGRVAGAPGWCCRPGAGKTLVGLETIRREGVGRRGGAQPQHGDPGPVGARLGFVRGAAGRRSAPTVISRPR